MGVIYKNIEDYHPNKKRKALIVFDILIDMLSNKKLNPIGTELFTRGRKQSNSLVFITQSYFTVSKNIRLNSMHYLILKIPNKWECKQITLHNSSDIDFNDFMNLYKKMFHKTIFLFGCWCYSCIR